MDEVIIPRSERHENFRVVVVALVAVLLVLLSFFILGGTRKMLGLEMTTFGWILRIFIILLAGVAIFVTKRQNGKKVYSFKGNKLMVNNRSALGGSGTKKMITIDPQSVSSVALSQTSLEKRLNSGTILIAVESRSGESIHKLENIDNPQLVLERIESYLER